MTSEWDYRGTAWLDGVHYHIAGLLDSDSMDGGRVVSLVLVRVDPEDEE